MPAASEIGELAQQILNELEAARAAGADLQRGGRGVGVRLRTLLTLTDPSTGALHAARLMVLTALGRTEIGDQIRRSGGCHTGAERAVPLAEDTDFDLLTDGLRRLAESADEVT